MAAQHEDQMDGLTSDILQRLEHNGPLLSNKEFPTFKSTEVKSALDRLASRSMVEYKTIDREEAVLEAEGQDITANGSHEARVFEALQKAIEGLTLAELEKAVGDKNTAKVGQSRAFKSKWINRGKEGRFVATVCSKVHGKLVVTNVFRSIQSKTRRDSSCRLFKIRIHTRTPRFLQT